jgi:gluconolactonase
LHFPCAVRDLSELTRLPAALATPRRSAWADANLDGAALRCFLEGPACAADGSLLVVDIPFGRVFRIEPGGTWQTIYAYEGWPNGMKLLPDGRLLVADHRRGLLRIDPRQGTSEVLADRLSDRPLLGLNDLAFGPDGALYLTDQGRTGLHDPSGRVLRFDGSRLECLLDICPSPNGLVFDRERPWLYVAMTRANAIWRVPLREGRPTKVGLHIQLSGGIGPDGLAVDARNRLLVGHPGVGVWLFDRHGLPLALYRGPADGYLTNLALRSEEGGTRLFVTDSIAGRIMTARLDD